MEKLLALLQRRKTDEGQQTTKGVGVVIDSHFKSIVNISGQTHFVISKRHRG